jgi:GNAT superfamily N-acetyltransferase
VIRPGTPADAVAVARVQVRTWQAAYAHVFPAERLAELSIERRADQWRGWPPLVAVADGVIVGFVSVGARRDDDAGGELFAIYVDPEHWGTGVGRELIAAGEERLRELGTRTRSSGCWTTTRARDAFMNELAGATMGRPDQLRSSG